jgi:hypothetical protein
MRFGSFNNIMLNSTKCEIYLNHLFIYFSTKLMTLNLDNAIYLLIYLFIYKYLRVYNTFSTSVILTLQCFSNIRNTVAYTKDSLIPVNVTLWTISLYHDCCDSWTQGWSHCVCIYKIIVNQKYITQFILLYKLLFYKSHFFLFISL